MLMGLSGIVAALFGANNLRMARKYPDRSDVGVLRGLGYVTITCGSIMILCELLVLVVSK